MDEIKDNSTRESRNAAYRAAPEIEQVFGTADALDPIDSVVALGILEFMQSRPALGKSDRIALQAIANLAVFSPDMARQFIGELLHWDPLH